MLNINIKIRIYIYIKLSAVVIKKKLVIRNIIREMIF